jgi:hypothetical protein
MTPLPILCVPKFILFSKATSCARKINNLSNRWEISRLNQKLTLHRKDASKGKGFYTQEYGHCLCLLALAEMCTPAFSCKFLLSRELTSICSSNTAISTYTSWLEPRSSPVIFSICDVDGPSWYNLNGA